MSGGEVEGQTGPTICAKCVHILDLSSADVWVMPGCARPEGQLCKAQQLGMDFVYGGPIYAPCAYRNKGDCADYEPRPPMLAVPSPELYSPPARRSIWRFLGMR